MASQESPELLFPVRVGADLPSQRGHVYPDLYG